MTEVVDQVVRWKRYEAGHRRHEIIVPSRSEDGFFHLRTRPRNGRGKRLELTRRAFTLEQLLDRAENIYGQ